MRRQPASARGSGRSSDNDLGQLGEHYRLEKELANKLRNATREERRELYSRVYDEFYKRVPGPSAPEMAKELSRQVTFLRRFLTRDQLLVELGPGDCSLAFAVSPLVNKVIAVDVSKEVSARRAHPENFQLLISDGLSVPLSDNVASVVYSNQLMEHLHPDDALLQLRSIYRVLVSGGIYICVTPNRLNGPHDVSKHFDDVATGFHLKEYTTTELTRLFTAVGFADIKVYCGVKGLYRAVPKLLVRLVEGFLSGLPLFLRLPLARSYPLRVLLGIRLVGIK